MEFNKKCATVAVLQLAMLLHMQMTIYYELKGIDKYYVHHVPIVLPDRQKKQQVARLVNFFEIFNV